MSLLLCSRPGKPGFVFCAFYPLSPGERGRVRGSGRTGLHIAPGDSHPPRGVQHAKKKPAFSCELFFKYGGEGGIDSLRSPCGQTVRYALSLSNWLSPVVEPRSGDSHPPRGVQHTKKKPAFSCELFFKYGGEGGIRTPDTLPYTHFPGVLLQPLGHLTILFCCLTAWGATGRYYRELR